MRIHGMSEPTTAGLAGIGLGKLLGISVGAVAVAFVVMCLTQPQSRREWVVALVRWCVLHRWFACVGAGAWRVRLVQRA